MFNARKLETGYVNDVLEGNNFDAVLNSLDAQRPEPS